MTASAREQHLLRLSLQGTLTTASLLVAAPPLSSEPCPPCNTLLSRYIPSGSPFEGLTGASLPVPEPPLSGAARFLPRVGTTSSLPSLPDPEGFAALGAESQLRRVRERLGSSSTPEKECLRLRLLCCCKRARQLLQEPRRVSETCFGCLTTSHPDMSVSSLVLACKRRQPPRCCGLVQQRLHVCLEIVDHSR